MKQHYELTYIVSIKYLEAELTAVIEEVAGFIKEVGGEITADNIIGKQRLAYPIDNIHQGTYVAVEFDMEHEKVKKVDKQLSLMNSLLRHLTIVKHVKTEAELNQETKLQDKLRKQKEEELEQLEKETKTAVKKQVDPTPVPKAEPSTSEEPKPALREAQGDTAQETKKPAPESNVGMDEIDKKIDEILTDDLI
jgi:small subunit ribosomal protein S6